MHVAFSIVGFTVLSLPAAVIAVPVAFATCPYSPPDAVGCMAGMATPSATICESLGCAFTCPFTPPDISGCQAAGYSAEECKFGNESKGYDCPYPGAISGVMRQERLSVPILESPTTDGQATVAIDITTPQGTFMRYFSNHILGWMIGVCIGMVTLWGVICGAGILIAGGDSGARGTWIHRFVTAILGMILLLATGGILRFLNDIFFVV